MIINCFILNNNDGAAGVESADDADSDSYDTIGFDVDAVNVEHPWALVPQDTPIWDHLKDLGDACGNMYLGLDECGTLKLRAKLKTGYSDPSSLETITLCNSGEPTSLGRSCYHNLFAYCENISFQNCTNTIFINIINSEFMH